MTKYYALALMIILLACNKNKLDNSLSQQATYKDYYPAHVGKEMIYRLDSIVPAPFGVRLDTVSYHLRDVFAQQTVSGSDTSYRIDRYMTDVAEKNPWTYQYSYTAALKNNTLEVTEKENVNQEQPVPLKGLVELNFIKLANPLNENTRWNGNRYFSSGNAVGETYLYKYNGWEYAYLNIGKPFETPAGAQSHTLTVRAIDQVSGDQNIADPVNFQVRILSEEVYAKNIGLVYKCFIFTEFQDRNSHVPGYNKQSFGIKLSLVRAR